MESSVIDVVIGIIRDQQGNILLSKRNPGSHQGSLWEFPGGKKKQGESDIEALNRELQEELGIQVITPRFFMKLRYIYPDCQVELSAWYVDRWEGKPHSREGQQVEWIEPGKLADLDFPPANKKLIKAMRLPRLYLICPFPGNNHTEFINRIESFIRAGVNLLQLRCDETVLYSNKVVVNKAYEICESNDAILMINAKPESVEVLDAHGIHLKSSRLLQLSERPVDNNYYLSASCHTIDEIEHANKIDVDFITVSPVCQTGSHPESVPMGWKMFGEITAYSDIPVYALGGMLPFHMKDALKSGANGIAVLSGIWHARNPEEVIRQCHN